MSDLFLNNINIFLLFIGLNFFLIHIFNFKPFLKYFRSYDAIQKIHCGYIPRIAGLSLFIFLFLISFNNLFFFSNYIFQVLMISIPLVYISLFEDLFIEISPLIRSIFLIISASFLVIFFLKDFPTIELPILNYFVKNYPFINYILFISCIYILCNSINLVDGVNGLAFFNCISIIMSLILLSTKINDPYFQSIFQFLLLCYLIQLFFNFPISKFFMGDLGSYFAGFILSALIINFFANNNLLMNSWVAVLIIFYPIFELLFSTFRRLYLRKRLTSPDNNHLHHLVYSFLNKRLRSKFANPLTSIILLPLCFFPFLWISYFDVLNSIILCFTGIALQVCLYISTYFFFKKLNKCKI